MFRLVCLCQLVSLALELLLVAPSINQQHSLLTSCSGQQPSPDPPQSLRCEGGSEGGQEGGREGVKVDKREGGSEGGRRGREGAKVDEEGGRE